MNPTSNDQDRASSPSDESDSQYPSDIGPPQPIPADIPLFSLAQDAVARSPDCHVMVENTRKEKLFCAVCHRYFVPTRVFIMPPGTTGTKNKFHQASWVTYYNDCFRDETVAVIPNSSRLRYVLCNRKFDITNGSKTYNSGVTAHAHAALWNLAPGDYRKIKRVTVNPFLEHKLCCSLATSPSCRGFGPSYVWEQMDISTSKDPKFFCAQCKGKKNASIIKEQGGPLYKLAGAPKPAGRIVLRKKAQLLAMADENKKTPTVVKAANAAKRKRAEEEEEEVEDKDEEYKEKATPEEGNAAEEEEEEEEDARRAKRGTTALRIDVNKALFTDPEFMLALQHLRMMAASKKQRMTITKEKEMVEEEEEVEAE